MTKVILHYRVMFGEEQVLPMNGGIKNGGTVTKSSEYAATVGSPTLSNAGLEPGGMIRYYVVAYFEDGRSSRSPSSLPPETAGYMGAVLPQKKVSALPTLHWFTENPDWAATRKGCRGALYFMGDYYDDVHCRVRGATSVRWAKKSFKFSFPRESPFQLTEDTEPVREFNLNTTVQDKAYLREPLAYEIYRQCGVPAPLSYNVRVERNGKFYCVSTVVEQIDEQFLKRNSLSRKGLLYKVMDSRPSYMDMEQKVPDKFSDAHLEFLDRLRRTSDPGKWEALLFEHVNVPAMVNYLAAGTVMRDWDRPFHNYYLYRNTESKWTMFPWDKDLTLGEVWRSDSISGEGRFGHPYYGKLGTGKEYNVVFDAMFSVSTTRTMYLRRLRTLMDVVFQPEETPIIERKLEERIDQLARDLAADARIDLQVWGSGVIAAQSERITFDEAIRDLKEIFLSERRAHLYEEHGPGSATGIPNAQDPLEVIRNNLAILWDSDRYCLRLENRSKVAVDLSDMELSGTMRHRFEPGTVLAPAGTIGSVLFLIQDKDDEKKHEPQIGFIQRLKTIHKGDWSDQLLDGLRLVEVR